MYSVETGEVEIIKEMFATTAKNQNTAVEAI
jgi:hypothetical protein